ncbi:hypothetical protein Tco_0351831 [Tanacetum coccineum]
MSRNQKNQSETIKCDIEDVVVAVVSKRCEPPWRPRKLVLRLGAGVYDSWKLQGDVEELWDELAKLGLEYHTNSDGNSKYDKCLPTSLASLKANHSINVVLFFLDVAAVNDSPIV